MSKMDTWFRKFDPRRPKDPSDLFAWKDGEIMVVLRPENQAKKLEGLNAIPVGTPHVTAQAMFQALLDDQPHRFIGYAGKKGNILDKWGMEKEPTFHPGDSFVGMGSGVFEPPVFMQTRKFHKETWDGNTVLVLPRPDLKGDSNTGIVLSGSNAGSIVLRGGSAECDCHIPTLNRIWTGDPERHWTKGPENATHAEATSAAPEATA